MTSRTSLSKVLPLRMVGSCVFGRYPKISLEKTFNMIVSDDWLVPYAGYKLAQEIKVTTKGGRDAFNSVRWGKLILVFDNEVYSVDKGLVVVRIAKIETSSGEVFITENDNNKIGICDKKNIYIYNYSTSAFTTLNKHTLGFIPSSLEFQNGYLIATVLNKPEWQLSEINNALQWPGLLVGEFQTKPDNAIATIKIPGRGNQLLVFGRTVTELWTNVKLQLFPYQKSTAFNIDYGVLNTATIAAGENFVIWLGSNEKSGPVIMYTEGGDIKTISNDGINFELANIQYPDQSAGFLFKQDGHLFYQLTFYNKADAITYAYDFLTKRFYLLTNYCTSFHIAKKVVFFNNKYYFISFSDGKLYEMSSTITNYDGKLIPRIRITPSLSLPDRSGFILNNQSFPIEQGYGDISTDSLGKVRPQFIDQTISKDGGMSFGAPQRILLNSLAERKNRINFWGLGFANEAISQFRFSGDTRFVIGNGTSEVYQ